MRFQPRPMQQEVISYSGGRMGVAAVPGSGKTVTLSFLASELLASGELADDQEVLVVTLVNAAVENFSNRVGEFIKQRGMLPKVGYRVRTLHGLAHDIVRERPALVGLSEEFLIIDEREAEQLLDSAASRWIRDHPEVLDEFIKEDLTDRSLSRVRRFSWPNMVRRIASIFIRQVKDLSLTPVDPLQIPRDPKMGSSLLKMGWEIYEDYQSLLGRRGGVDFDDLIRLALLALRTDPEYLQRLQHRWPYILEDEAQDSSRLQEQILAALVGSEGNWIRVGDPNQAIFETFTTASPLYLRAFLRSEGVTERTLATSGRSTQGIIDLANFLIDWANNQHPVEAVSNSLSPPFIQPVPEDDPQSNPVDQDEVVHLVALPYTPEEELLAVATSLERWLPEHQDETVAVLVPRNQRGFELATELKARSIPHVEILRSTFETRETASTLSRILKHMAEPELPNHLASVYREWRKRLGPSEGSKVTLEEGMRAIRSCRRVEEYLWPSQDRDWMADFSTSDPIREELVSFRTVMRRWHEAVVLPIDQLILSLAQDLFTQPSELALAYKLANYLRNASLSAQDWSLPEFRLEIELIAHNERRFLGFGADDLDFDPEIHKGEVVISTIHKAKGLEWDRVYLMSVNNYNFPSGEPHDSYISEQWFVRDNLNLEAEAIDQLRSGQSGLVSTLGEASARARYEYAAERLRLLFVGVTRAKSQLIITWNTGKDHEKSQATPFVAMESYWQERSDGSTD